MKLLFHTGKPFVSYWKTFYFTVQNFLFHNEKPVVSEQNCYSDLTMKDTPSTVQRGLRTLTGVKVRLAKIAQYIAIFRLTAVAPYLKPHPYSKPCTTSSGRLVP